MSFLRRHCWYCAAGESAHVLVAVKKRSPFEYSAFVICPECQMPSCAVLQSTTAVDEDDARIIACEGDICESSWRVIDLWPNASTIAPFDSTQAMIACEPAEKAYRRALDMTKHTRAERSGAHGLETSGTAAHNEAKRSDGVRRITLREFSERFAATRR